MAVGCGDAAMGSIIDSLLCVATVGFSARLTIR